MNRGSFLTLGLVASLLMPVAITAQTSNGQPTDQPAGTTSSTDNTPLKKAKPAKARKQEDAPAPKQVKAPKAAKPAKEDKAKPSPDTKVQLRKDKKVSKKDPLAGLDKDSPDKALYDKALVAIKSGHFDIARLDLQVMMNTYPESEYLMRSKLAFADSWFREGGSAALDQAEAEYKDFITFFPNAPEAAEAQMRVGDIYFKEMDKSDRDLAKAEGAQREYRNMLTQFPDAPKELLEQATQRLRDVQEVLATREADTGNFYASHDNWNAAMAHYQTVLDTYPLFSHIDEVLINMGDIFETQARLMHNTGYPEDMKARLEKQNHDMAEAAYDKVITEHAAAAHVEDAKDRLAAMDRPMPTPTPQQIAASTALENSRAAYTFASRASLLFLHKPDVVQSARVGDPTLTDPAATNAAQVYRKRIEDMQLASKGISPVASVTSPAAGAANGAAPASFAPAPAAGGSTGGGSLQFEEVPTAKSGVPSSTSATVSTMAPANTSSAPTSMGMEIVQPTANATKKPATNSLPAVGPADAKELPPIEKAADAPTQHNDVKPGSSTGATSTTAATTKPGKKPKKAPVDKSSESSSQNKPKKGLGKLNPF